MTNKWSTANDQPQKAQAFIGIFWCKELQVPVAGVPWRPTTQMVQRSQQDQLLCLASLAPKNFNDWLGIHLINCWSLKIRINSIIVWQYQLLKAYHYWLSVGSLDHWHPLTIIEYHWFMDSMILHPLQTPRGMPPRQRAPTFPGDMGQAMKGSLGTVPYCPSGYLCDQCASGCGETMGSHAEHVRSKILAKYFIYYAIFTYICVIL